MKFDGRVRYLGPYGSQESQIRYKEAIAEWTRLADMPAAYEAATVVPTPELTVSGLILKYCRHALNYYRKCIGSAGR